MEETVSILEDNIWKQIYTFGVMVWKVLIGYMCLSPFCNS